MSKQQFLFRGNTVLAAIIASGFILSAPAFSGTIFPDLRVCFQAAMFLILIGLIVHAIRARKQKEAAQ